MPFALTRKIIKAWMPPEEFKLIIVYGPLGYGKSAYQFKVSVEVLKEIYHLSDEEAWEKLKSFIVFHPSQFFQKMEEIEKIGRVPFLNWDDAGLWLGAMKWNDPFVEAFIDWLNTPRSQLACLICSTPSPKWILKKLREFPEAITVRIVKPSGVDVEKFIPYTQENFWKRAAKGYHYWDHPDLRHSGVRIRFIDTFNCKMPDNFYRWYKPIRDKYEKLARKIWKDRWEKLKKEVKVYEEYFCDQSLPSIN